MLTPSPSVSSEDSAGPGAGSRHFQREPLREMLGPSRKCGHCRGASSPDQVRTTPSATRAGRARSWPASRKGSRTFPGLSQAGALGPPAPPALSHGWLWPGQGARPRASVPGKVTCWEAWVSAFFWRRFPLRTTHELSPLHMGTGCGLFAELRAPVKYKGPLSRRSPGDGINHWQSSQPFFKSGQREPDGICVRCVAVCVSGSVCVSASVCVSGCVFASL